MAVASTVPAPPVPLTAAPNFPQATHHSASGNDCSSASPRATAQATSSTNLVAATVGTAPWSSHNGSPGAKQLTDHPVLLDDQAVPTGLTDVGETWHKLSMSQSSLPPSFDPRRPSVKPSSWRSGRMLSQSSSPSLSPRPDGRADSPPARASFARSMQPTFAALDDFPSRRTSMRCPSSVSSGSMLMQTSTADSLDEWGDEEDECGVVLSTGDAGDFFEEEDDGNDSDSNVISVSDYQQQKARRLSAASASSSASSLAPPPADEVASSSPSFARRLPTDPAYSAGKSEWFDQVDQWRNNTWASAAKKHSPHSLQRRETNLVGMNKASSAPTLPTYRRATALSQLSPLTPLRPLTAPPRW